MNICQPKGEGLTRLIEHISQIDYAEVFPGRAGKTSDFIGKGVGS